MVSEEQEGLMNEENYDLLCSLAAHPIDLNKATREELEQLPFLTATQVEDILAYIYQYHGMRSVGELLMIESLDTARSELLSCFVTIKIDEQKHFPPLATILKYGKHDITFTMKAPFYERKGDKNGYLGYPYTHSLRYKFSYSDYFRAGLVGAQDSGEPFFANRNALGYDHYSFYISVRKLGRIKSAVAGRYKVRFGQGLIINNDFSFGKTMTLLSQGRSYTAIRPYSSRSHANYLQGGAATVALTRHIDLSAFASYRKNDATLNADGTIRTLLKSGYHRTPTEMKKKNNISQTTFGGNLQWFDHGFRAGLTALYTHFDRPLMPNTGQTYRSDYPQGYDFWNVGVSYGYLNYRWNMNGEIAMSGNGAVATLNSLSFQPTKRLSLTAIQRYYGSRYWALHANAFSEGGQMRNEMGMLVGANWTVNRFLALSAYTDYAYFRKPRYRASVASSAWDNYISAIYTRGNLSFLARYRFKIREKDNADHTKLINEYTQRTRFAFTCSGLNWDFKTQADLAYNHHKTNSFGYMLSEFVAWQPLSWLQTSANIGYFHTADFASRLYIYERSMLYSFSFPTFYGKGIRWSVFARANLRQNLSVLLKVGTTHYFDRKHISSGLQQINRSEQTDLEVQLHWKV
ncbi:helix-hairpin-helix domain-containing protein [Prevotella falsenii]